VRCFAAKRVCGRAECAARSASMTARYLPPQTSPTTGTTSPRTSHRSRRFFILTDQNHRSPAPSRLLSANDLACFVCSVVNALATPPLRYQSLAGKSVINTRTKNQATPCGWSFLWLFEGRDSTERPQNTAVRCFAAKRVCGRAECAARSASMTARYLPPQTSPTTGTTSPRTSHRSRRFFILTDQNHRSPAPSRLLSAIHCVTAEDRAFLARTMIPLASSVRL